MNLNGIIFPSPDFNFNYAESYDDELIYIPKKIKDKKKMEYIPCLFLRDFNKSKNFLLFFHGNAEDIFGARIMAEKMKNKLNINIIIIEYPGYSLYISSSKNSDIILENTMIVYDYIKEIFNLNDNNIFVFGRSIGTSPAIYLSSKRKPNALFVISGFSSIRAVADNLVGPFKVLLKDRFFSIDYIKKVTCPILFIHGQKDNLIPFNETLKLKDMCHCPYEVSLPEQMTHNDFNLEEDIILPIQIFISKNCPLDEEKNQFDFRNKNFIKLFKTPSYLEKLIYESN